MEALENSHQPSELRFNPFNRLPREIREYIWELCLEPRVLCVNRQDYDHPVEILSYKNPPNPVTLRICQESRTVTLRQYKLMPHHGGTGLVYANFSGEDILYFDMGYWTMLDMLRELRQRPQSSSPSPSTFKDHDAAWWDPVERVIIDADCPLGESHRSTRGQRDPSVRLIRTCILAFPKLRQLSAEKSPSCGFNWSQPATIQQRQIEPYEDNTYQRNVRDVIAEVFANVVEEDELSTRKPLEVSTVTLYMVPKAPTIGWMVDLSTPIAR
jgi:hypothetical protein